MKVAGFVVNYNMPERTDALVEAIQASVQQDCDLYVIDNGSDLVEHSQYSNVLIKPNCQTTGRWLAGLQAADKSGVDYGAYWFLITSAEMDGKEDLLTPLVELLEADPQSVGVHSALTKDSTTAWKHMITRRGDKPRQTWMIDNIASLWRAEWFDANGRFDPALKYGWGIDLETCWIARQQGRSLWLHEGCRVKKVTDIGYTMGRMRMSAQARAGLAGENMREVLSARYGHDWWERMLNENVEAEWR